MEKQRRGGASRGAASKWMSYIKLFLNMINNYSSELERLAVDLEVKFHNLFPLIDAKVIQINFLIVNEAPQELFG